MSNLTNIGIDLGFIHDSIGRMIICLTTDDSGTTNKISLSNAAAIANWQTQFNQYAFLSDASDKYVPTPILREVVKEEGEATFWEVEDYKRKMRNADVDISASLLDPSPYILKNLAEYEDETISAWFITTDTIPKAIGILDGTDLKPFPIKVNSFSVPNYSPGGYEEGSRNVFTFRLNSGADLNSIVSVAIADADVTDDTDFFSLRTSSATISSPALTGCVFTPTVDDVDPTAPATDINITGIVFGEVVFRDRANDSTVSLADANSISYSSGAYTVNEAGLLTTGHTYDIETSHSGYDVVFTNACVVP